VSRQRIHSAALAIVCAALACAMPAWAQWTVSSSDGASQIKLGFLTQMQVEGLKSPGSQDWAQNVFVRRARLMLGGRIDSRTSFFIDTETANLGKGQAAGAKVANTVVLQDVVLTRTLRRGMNIDAGMMYTPSSHHSMQAVGSLLAMDYSPYSFLQSDVTDSKGGRDYGLQSRSYFAGQHAELRLGAFQGDRGRNATLPLRTAVRVVYYPFEADTGFFYTGTAFGKRKLLAIGASHDAQKSYATWAGDVSLDWPVRSDCVTLQADYMRYDGREMFPALPRQDALLVEVGYTLHRAHLTPYVQYSDRDYEDPLRSDESRWQGGLAYWFNGHRESFKIHFTKLVRDAASDGLQCAAEWQVLAF